MTTLMTLISLFVFIFAVVKSESETVDVTLINYDAMYQKECSPSTGSTGSTSTNDNSNKENAAFCKCLATKVTDKTYNELQNDFSKCMQKANDDDASHWEKIAQKYAHKYPVQVDPDSWEVGDITTAKPVKIAVTAAGSDLNLNSNEKISDSNEQNIPISTENIAADAAMLMNIGNDNDINNGNNDGSDNYLLYGTLIGAFVLLLIFIWYIKGVFKKYKVREYQFVNQMSESEANKNGDAYGGNYNDDVWSDDDLNYEQNKDHDHKKLDKKGKFSGWNQYSAV